MISRSCLALVVGLISAGCPAPSLATPSGGSLELRGVVIEGDEQFFSLYDPGSRVSTWVRLQESGYPFKVQDYDSTRDVAIIEYQGRRLALGLKRAKVVLLKPAAAVQQVRLGIPLDVVSSSETIHLGAIIQEVRLRQELRARAGRQRDELDLGDEDDG